MTWVLLIFAVLAIGGAAGCFWYRQRLSQEIALMAATATTNAANVAKLAPGSVVEVKGSLRCTGPLKAEFSGEACVWHKSEIVREITYYARKSDGKYERRTRNDTVHSNIRFAPCTVQDSSGSVALTFEGADVEGKEVVNRREHEPQHVVASLINIATGGRESSVLIHTEAIVPADIPVYALGEVQPDRSIGKPAEGSKNRTFVISTKSEEERTKDLRRTMLWLMIGAIVLGAVGVVLGYFGIPR